MTGILGPLAAQGGGGILLQITAGTSGSNVGYSNGAGTGGGTYGSISKPPAGVLPSGKNVGAVFDLPGTGGEFVISGLSSDPTQSSLLSVSMNGATRTGASATYSFGSGIARWIFASLWGFTNGNTYTGVIQKSLTSSW